MATFFIFETWRFSKTVGNTLRVAISHPSQGSVPFVGKQEGATRIWGSTIPLCFPLREWNKRRLRLRVLHSCDGSETFLPREKIQRQSTPFPWSVVVLVYDLSLRPSTFELALRLARVICKHNRKISLKAFILSSSTVTSFYVIERYLLKKHTTILVNHVIIWFHYFFFHDGSISSMEESCPNHLILLGHIQRSVFVFYTYGERRKLLIVFTCKNDWFEPLFYKNLPSVSNNKQINSQSLLCLVTCEMNEKYFQVRKHAFRPPT